MAASFEGFSKPSKNKANSKMIIENAVITATAYATSSYNSFNPTYTYNSQGYTGILPTNGASYVYSGSYSPANSFIATSSTTGTGYVNTATGAESGQWPTALSYNDGTYSGTLYYSSMAWLTDSYFSADSLYICRNWVAYYSGTVTKPSSDTRVYKQDYKGLALKLKNKKYRRVTLC